MESLLYKFLEQFKLLVIAVQNIATRVSSGITSLSGDVEAEGSGAVVATIPNETIDNPKLAHMATSRFKGRVTAGTGEPQDITGTQATTLLSNFVGDSGSGGTKGLVPAPAAGDAAADKFLKADGTWDTAGGGTSYLAWMGKYLTISASNGIGYGTYPYTYFGAITIPANTVQAGDIIEIKALFRSNGAGTSGPWIGLRDHASMPSSTANYDVADSNGHKTFATFCNASGAYHEGFNSSIIAAGTGFTAPAANTNPVINNAIYDSFTFQSANFAEVVNATMAWSSDRYVVFGHTSAVATLMTFMGAWVKIYRPA